MKLIVGLGNPGPEYARTRHNVGFMAIDQLVINMTDPAMKNCWQAKFHAQILEVRHGLEKLVLMKPLTYMNRSGLAVAEAVNFFKLEPEQELLVILDDTALPLGDIRLRASGSSGSHNGLTDIEQKLATREYPRLRIGIDEPGMLSLTNYVLGRFAPDEIEIVENAVKQVPRIVKCWLEQGMTTAMNQYNKRKSDAKNNKTENESDDLDNCENNRNKNN